MAALPEFVLCYRGEISNDAQRRQSNPLSPLAPLWSLGNALAAEQRIDRSRGHFLHCALREVAQLERAEGDADQAAHMPAEMLADAPDLAILPFFQREGNPGVAVLLPFELRLNRPVVH